MITETFFYSIVRISAVLVAFIATYAVQSTLLLGATWLVTRRVRRHEARELLWKVAVIAGLGTALLQTTGAVNSITGNHDVSRVVEARVWEDAPMSLAVGQQPGRHIVFGARLPESWSFLRALPLLLATAWLLYALFVLGRVSSATTRARRALGPRFEVDEQTVVVRFRAVCARLGLRRVVRLTLSSEMTSPVALGNAEICIPRKIVTDLTPDELECVLAHEAAHLVRRDPSWLLAAVTVESLFFFQPLNRVARMQIQEESEYLADDLAARDSTTSVTLARCLSRVAEWLTPASENLLAPALTEHRSSLVRRVQRLLDRAELDTKPYGRTRHLAAAALLPVLVLIVAPGFSPGGARAWGTSAFHWEEAIEAGKSIEIKGTMGNIQAESWNGRTVVVNATRHGRTSNPDVRFEVARSPMGVTICAVYPTPAGVPPNTCEPGGAGRDVNTKANDTEIEFLVRVPAGVGFIARTATGDISTNLLSAPIAAYSAAGDIDVATTEYARASSASGNVSARMGRTSWMDTLRVSSNSGNVRVTLRPDADTEIIAASRAGGVHSDFPLPGTHRNFFQRFRFRNSIGEQVAGVIGSGGRVLRLSSLSGDISVRRAR